MLQPAPALVRAFVEGASRRPRQKLVPIPFDAAAAEDGLPPVLLVANGAVAITAAPYGLAAKITAKRGMQCRQLAH